MIHDSHPWAIVDTRDDGGVYRATTQDHAATALTTIRRSDTTAQSATYAVRYRPFPIGGDEHARIPQERQL